jgi:uncharacterized membrane protein
MLTVVVGLAAGSASAFALTTKGPTALIGVMIAAALIPAAATVGIATVWGFPVIAVGSLVLLIISVAGINLAAFATFWYLDYRPNGFDRSLWNFEGTRQAAVVALSVLAILVFVGGAAVATYQQVTYERTVNREVSAVLDDRVYQNLTYVQTNTQYGFTGDFFEPETVTITVSRTSDREYPRLVNRLQRRISTATGQNPVVRVHFVDYETAATSEQSRGTGNATTSSQSRSSVGDDGGGLGRPALESPVGI